MTIDISPEAVERLCSETGVKCRDNAKVNETLRALSATLTASQAKTAAYEAGRAAGLREAASIVARHGEIGRKSLGASQDLGTATIWSSIVARCDMIGEAILAAIPKGKDHE